eukprot:83124_1
MGSVLDTIQSKVNTNIIIWLGLFVLTMFIGFKIIIVIIFLYLLYKFLANDPPICSKLLDIEEFVKDQIWTRDYFISYVGIKFYARCTVIKLSNNKYIVHSPSPIDDIFDSFFSNKEIEYIIAPGNYHYFNVAIWHKKYPKAKILIVPGVEYKAKDLKSSSIYGILHDNYIDNDINSVFNKDFELSLIRGFYEINEIVLFHKNTSTIIAVDVIEYVTDKYSNRFNRFGHLWWYLLRMHNVAFPAPEYQFTLKHKNLAKQSFDKILDWEFDKIIISHGENVNPQHMDKKHAVQFCKQFCQKCWYKYLT